MKKGTLVMHYGDIGRNVLDIGEVLEVRFFKNDKGGKAHTNVMVRWTEAGEREHGVVHLVEYDYAIEEEIVKRALAL